MTNIIKILLVIFSLSSFVLAQEKSQNEYGTIYRYELTNTPFPHKLRENGHSYKGVKYSMEDHYSDQSVIVFIPNYFTMSDSIDIVFYFHGWRNNIDTTLVSFNLLEQFYKSNKNAILVLPESAKNSPDSFGGKLEEKNTFKDLTEEIIDKINALYNRKLKVGDISLAGHSGAYRVIAYILDHGGLTNKIEAVYLFDGLYADIDKYSFWINNYKGKFINIYTPNGGTKAESEELYTKLEKADIGIKMLEKDEFSSKDTITPRIIFIKSELNHNEVIHTKNQFLKFLESSL